MSENVKNTAKICFVIRPFDKRGESVLTNLIEPVCEREGYIAISADKQLTSRIIDGIITSLSVSPMVIAYLGRHPWNANVILEVGFRLATRRPMVMLCDDVENLDLPFNIAQDRVVLIPPASVDGKEADAAIDRIRRQFCETERNSLDLESNMAVAVIHAPRGSLKQKEAIYVRASELANQLFGVDGKLVGRTVWQFVHEDRRVDMPDYQYKAFTYEQKRLTTAHNPSGQPVIARTPMILKRGQGERRAFLPIIVKYQEVGEIQEFTVLYLEVTSVTDWIEDPLIKQNYYYSKLETQCDPMPELKPDKHVVKRSDGIFLAYNSDDRDRVRKVYRILSDNGGHPWFDEEAHLEGHNFVIEIDKAIESCQAAFVFVGKRGFGKYHEKIEVTNLIVQVINRGIPVVPILLDDIESPPKFLRSYAAIPYEKALSKEWIVHFIQKNIKEKTDHRTEGQPPHRE